MLVYTIWKYSISKDNCLLINSPSPKCLLALTLFDIGLGETFVAWPNEFTDLCCGGESIISPIVLRAIRKWTFAVICPAHVLLQHDAGPSSLVTSDQFSLFSHLSQSCNLPSSFSSDALYAGPPERLMKTVERRFWGAKTARYHFRGSRPAKWGPVVVTSELQQDTLKSWTNSEGSKHVTLGCLSC